MPSNRGVATLWAFFGFGVGFFVNLLMRRVRASLKNGNTGDGTTSANDTSNGIMEIIFTNDHTEEVRTHGVPYLAVSDLNNFTPRNLSRIIEIINSAERTIDSAVYLFNVKELGKAMIDAHKRGVKVRIVGCKSMAGASGTQFPELTKAGIRVLFKQGSVMIMHHKFCLVDTRQLTPDEIREKEKNQMRRLATENQLKKKGEATPASGTPAPTTPPTKVQLPQNGVCITGSCNWTMQGFAGNWENIIVTSHTVIVSAFQREFDRIYADFLQSEAAELQKKIMYK